MKQPFRPAIIPRLETWPWLVQFVQTKPGKVVIAAVFGGVLALNGETRALMLSIALLAMSLWPQYRRPLVALATFYSLLVFSLGANGASLHDYVAVLLVFLCAGLCVYEAQLRPNHWIFRRPVRNLLIFYGALVVLVSYLPTNGFAVTTLGVFVLFFGKYLWFLGYALLNRHRKTGHSLLLKLFHFQPFWGSTNVPYPKGESYLARVEAKTPNALAVTQLKGLKLLLWASVLSVILALFNQVVHGADGSFTRWLPGHLGVPTLINAIAAYLGGHPFPRDLCWLSVFANFCSMVLRISIMGHLIIASCRMAGFNALRSTYNPLAASSISEFYNRIYYYFKELLVDFFFYPTYLRYFKDRPRLRLFFATLAAAGFGNLLYHLLAALSLVPQFGLWGVIVGFHVYAIYALILGLAIAFSQLRSLGRPPSTQRLSGTLGVLCFYSLIMILDCRNLNWSIVDYGSFIANLFIPYHA